MEFRIDPTPLSRRRSRQILAATAAVVLGMALLVGALTLGNTRPNTAVVPTVATTTPVLTARPTATSSPAPTILARTGPPPRVICHDVADQRCQSIARAALTASEDPTLPWPTQVEVWASLLCGSTFDCPPGRITAHQTEGSAIVTAGSVGLWVNVVGLTTRSGATTLDAWVIRTGPIV
jgi:hypothetical protein